MTTIKSYTNLAQSRKLSEILPIESADMCWTQIYDENHIMSDHRVELIPFRFYSGVGVPCWSLVALLNVLPDSIYDNTDKYSQLEFSKKSVAYFDMNDGIKIGSIKDNLVDACYEMILRLKKLNLL